MSSPRNTLTLKELERWLSIELVRADASFQEAQIAARMALARDLFPGEERIAVNHLDIEELSLNFAVNWAKPSLWTRIRCALGKLCGCKPANPTSCKQKEARFRFAPHDKGDVGIACKIRRTPKGSYQAECSVSGDQDHAQEPA